MAVEVLTFSVIVYKIMGCVKFEFPAKKHLIYTSQIIRNLLIDCTTASIDDILYQTKRG